MFGGLLVGCPGQFESSSPRLATPSRSRFGVDVKPPCVSMRTAAIDLTRTAR